MADVRADFFAEKIVEIIKNAPSGHWTEGLPFPRDTGKMQDSVRIKRKGKKSSTIVIGADAEYSHDVEFNPYLTGFLAGKPNPNYRFFESRTFPYIKQMMEDKNFKC